MKRVVDTPCFGESELINDGGKDFGDGEGAFAFWGEFRVGNQSFQVSGFEPDFVSFVKGGEVSMGAGGHDLSC